MPVQLVRLTKFASYCCSSSSAYLQTFENISFDQLWDNWRDRKLQIPLLSEDVGMNRHVLTLYSELHGKGTYLDHFAELQADGKRDLVAALGRVPVHQHV